jgi:opacity protein-like surface antigen
MKNFLLGTILLTAAFSSAVSAQIADTVYTNGKIYTVNEKKPWVEAVAIKNGKFMKVGTNADIKAVIGKATKVINLGAHSDASDHLFR